MDKHDVTLVNDDFTDVTLPQARLIAALDSDPAPRAGPPRSLQAGRSQRHETIR